MLEKKLFFGGLNSDDEDRLVQNGDYRYALNIRNSRSDQDSVGAVENVKGDTLISVTLPSGINKCVGTKNDIKNNRVIYFVWNSLSNHTIYEYNIGTGGVVNLMQSSVLNFNPAYPILHCDIIDDLMYWTDEYNPPRKINIERARTGGYTLVNEQTVTAIQYAPNYSPATQYGSNGAVNYNKVRGKVFQFKYSFIYDDNEISAFSPVSKVAIPANEALYTFGGYYENSLDNHIQITINTGNYLCKRIQVIAREGNSGDWVLVKELDKAELSIGDNSTYIYSFYNDEVYIPITQALANRLFDYVPLLAGAQSMINGNRLTYSDITEGYDNIEVNATAVPFYNEYPPAITSRVAVPVFSPFPPLPSPSFSLSATDSNLDPLNSSNQVTRTQHILIDANTVNPTDVWNQFCRVEVYNASITPSPTITAFYDSFVKQFTASDTSQTIAEYFRDQINTSSELNKTNAINSGIFVNAILSTTATATSYSAGVYLLTVTYHITVTFNVSSGFPSMAARMQTGINLTTDILEKTLKHNSKYSVAIVYYDDANRSGVCQVSGQLDMETKSHSFLNNHGTIGFTLSVSHLPPVWAKYYQILITDNRSVSSFIQTDTGAVSVLGNQVKIYINTLEVYNIQSGGKANLSYSWAKGDRVTFIKDSMDAFYPSFYDLEIISSDTDGGGQFIMVDNVLPVSLNNGVLIELYTPKLNTDQIFFWEIGEVYPIVNGFHTGNTQTQTSSQGAIVTVNSGDCYFRYRGNNISSFVEDFSISDYYTSNYWDKGRPNIVDKEFKQIRRYATTYYTEQYVPDTNINGLSTIFDTNFHEANKNYGAIQKTYADQDRIHFFQEIKTGFSLVNKDVLYNSSGTPNGVVGQANQVLSDVQYYAYQGGIGNYPESFAEHGTSKYHVDEVNGCVVRLSIDGYTVISNYKYSVFFRDLFKRRLSIARVNRGKIWGVYDIAFDEYVLYFESCHEPDQLVGNKTGTHIIPGAIIIEPDTVAYSELKNRWVTHYQIYPDTFCIGGIHLLVWFEGVLRKMNSGTLYNNFNGVQYNSMVRPISNQDPSNIKVYESMFEETNSTWSVALTTPGGQQSVLSATDFELNEGVYYAAFLKDSNTPNTPIPLIEGDDLRDSTMELELTNTSTSYVRLFAINIRYVYSQMTNK